MLLSAGLLLIYVVLCVVSFISARKEMAAQAARDNAKKAAVLKKASNRKSIDDEVKPKEGKSSGSKESPIATEVKKDKTTPQKDVDTKAASSSETKLSDSSPNESSQSSKASSSAEPAKPSKKPSTEDKKGQSPASPTEKTEPTKKVAEEPKSPPVKKEDADKSTSSPDKDS